MRIRTIVTYQVHCDVCGYGAGPTCSTIEDAQTFLDHHKRTNYHKRNAAQSYAVTAG